MAGQNPVIWLIKPLFQQAGRTLKNPAQTLPEIGVARPH
jgi:hypothetical protein